MAKNIEADAPVAEEAPTVVTTTVTRPRTGLLVGGIIGGAVLVGGLLFAGGVVVGINLPIGHGGPGIAQGQFTERHLDRGDLQGGPGQPGQLPQFGGPGQQGPGQQAPGQLQGPGGDGPIQPPADGDADNG
jgi:hypothetical protein